MSQHHRSEAGAEKRNVTKNVIKKKEGIVSFQINYCVEIMELTFIFLIASTFLI